MTSLLDFQDQIREGIPSTLPEKDEYDIFLNHAPKRKDILNTNEKKLALKNALRYFPQNLHPDLAPEFAKELEDYGRIYMMRYKPKYNGCTLNGVPFSERLLKYWKLLLDEIPVSDGVST